MSGRNFNTNWWRGPALAALVLTIGCGAADLYEAPVSPFRVIGSVATPSGNEGVACLGGYAYVAAGEAGLHVVSLADPAAPTLVRTVDTNKFAESVEIVRVLDGGRIWDVAIMVEATEGLSTYDVTDPATPVSFEQGGGAYDAQKIHVVPGDDPGDPYMVFMADSWRGLRLFRSVPGTPGAHVQLTNAVYSRGYTKDVDVRGDFAYVADDEMGLAVFDVGNPDFPELVSWADTDGNALGIDVEGGYAYVSDGTEGLVIFRIDGGATPVEVAKLDLSAYSKGIVVRNGWCLLAAADAGVHVVDVRDPEAPVFSGTVVTGYATDVDITEDGYIVVSDRRDGMLVLQGPDMTIDETPPGKVTSLTATPLDFSRVRLDWLAVGDDGLTGTADHYQVRYASEAIEDELDWDAATVAADAPSPAAPGTSEQMIVSGFSVAETVHFALRAVDDEGRTGTLSASPAATLYDGMALIDAGVDLYQSVGSHEFVFEATYLNAENREPTAAHDVVIDGESHAMSLVEGTPLTGALYRYNTVLSLEAHDFRFVFDDGEGLSVATDLDDGIFVLPRITFDMGSPPEEPGRDPDETQHTVGLRDSVHFEPHEVTQAEWTAAGMSNPSTFSGDDRPAESMTWFEAVAYCNARSADDGLTPAYAIDGFNVTWNRDAEGWRLPTEAEWEWACRDGNPYPLAGMSAADDYTDGDYSTYLDPVGWYEDNATATVEVAQKAANTRGLHDMHGNVWEWCWDWYGAIDADSALDPAGPDAGDRRVIRGGSWHYRAEDCRSASRGAYYPTSADDYVGLRVVRTVFE